MNWLSKQNKLTAIKFLYNNTLCSTKELARISKENPEYRFTISDNNIDKIIFYRIDTKTYIIDEDPKCITDDYSLVITSDLKHHLYKEVIIKDIIIKT